MAGSGRRSDGTFAPGHNIGRRGRPRRNYSIAQALSVAADQPQSVDDDGDPLTHAQIAAEWLWTVVRDGIDERQKPEGGTERLVVSTKDRLAALNTILARIEPAWKVTPEDVAAETDERAQAAIRRLEQLSEDELTALKKAAGKLEGAPPDGTAR